MTKGWLLIEKELFVIITSMSGVSIEFKLFLYVIIVLSAVFHEYAHAFVAYHMGDPTAKNMGRLTLNPIAHMDPIGTVLLPLFLLFFVGGFIGYAKPVPYNPYNLNDAKYGSAKVGVAGPLSNFFIAFLFAMALRFLELGGFTQVAFSWIVYVNIFLGLFNLIPIPPLDGSKILSVFLPSYGNSNSWGGVFLAIFVAMMFLPSVSRAMYLAFTGASFIPLAF